VGRILLAGIFLSAGFAKVADPAGTAAAMTAEGIPASQLLVWLAAAAEILGGLSLLVGLFARVGAAILILFLVPTTLIFHDFWAYSGQEQVMQMSNFFKNIAIMGGLALVIAYGAGRFSVDRKIREPLQP
jgi:putative oxidoreductase